MLGGEDGRIRIINIETGLLESEHFPEENFKSPIIVLTQSTAQDVLAVGLKNGSIYLKNIKKKKILCSYKQEGPITAISFRYLNFSSVYL